MGCRCRWLVPALIVAAVPASRGLDNGLALTPPVRSYPPPPPARARRCRAAAAAAAARCRCPLPLPLMILTGCVADRDLGLPILFIAAGWPCV